MCTSVDAPPREVKSYFRARLPPSSADREDAGVDRRSPTPPSASRWKVSNANRLRVHLKAMLFSPTLPMFEGFPAAFIEDVDKPRRVENRSLAGTNVFTLGKQRI